MNYYYNINILYSDFFGVWVRLTSTVAHIIIAIMRCLLSCLLFAILIGSAKGDNGSELSARNYEFLKADTQIIESKEGYNATSYGWTEYKQCDSRWSNEQLGTCSSTTICSAGCAMSSVAMILNTKGCKHDPSSLNSWLKSHGGIKSL